MKQTYLLLLFTAFFTTGFGQNKIPLYEGPPVFHGAKVVGNYTGTDFVFTVPATGKRPITFSVVDLPEGLKLDIFTGIVRGVANVPGEYKVEVSARNELGETTEEIKIIIGDELCLTPVMGWNSWNVFTKNIDEKMLMEMADAMVANGMRDLGYQYINMDDFWHADTRDSAGGPLPDPKKFPHGIRYVADYVHTRGLKLGIYSCAGTMTCGRRFGGYQHEEIDAKTYAAWGIDLLKYDYCYARPLRKEAVKRYTAMGTALKHSGRSIVFSICEWGFRKPWQWTKQVGGHYSRSTPDIMDTWRMPRIAVFGTMGIIGRLEKISRYAGPGHWNDGDMLIVGNYGKGNATGGGGIFKGLTDTEYQTHFSLWCMFNVPLLTSCDLRNMNATTTSILLNPAILDIDQDELGEQARLTYKMGGIRIYQKHLKDGSLAVAVFNTSGSSKNFDLKASVLQLKAGASYKAHDIWQATDNTFTDAMHLSLKSHETVVLKIAQ